MKMKKPLREEVIGIAFVFFDSIANDSWLIAFKLWNERMVKCSIVNGNYFGHI